MADVSDIPDDQVPDVVKAPASPAPTPAQAEAAQPGTGAQEAATGGEALQKAQVGAIQQSFGISGLYRQITTGQQLPSIYDDFATARKAGYSWDEIYGAYNQARGEAMKQGYSAQQINDANDLPTLDTEPAAGGSRAVLPPPSAFEENGIPGHIAGVLRDFASKYISPRDPTQAALDFKPTAGGILQDMGWNVVDAGKMLGRSVVDGAAATAEMLDGRARTLGDWGRLGWEASGFLGLFLPGPKGATAEAGASKAEFALPPKEDFLDAATAHADRNGESLTDNARVLGENYVQTREGPVEASERIHQDTVAADTFDRDAETERLAREGAPDLYQQYDALAKVRDSYSQMLQNPEFIKQEAGGAGAAQELDALIDQKTSALAGLKGKRLARAQNELDDLKTSREQFLSGTSPEVGVTQEAHEAAIRQSLQQTDYKMRDLAERISAAKKAGEEKFTAANSFFAPAGDARNGGLGAKAEAAGLIKTDASGMAAGDIAAVDAQIGMPGRFTRLAEEAGGGASVSGEPGSSAVAGPGGAGEPLLGGGQRAAEFSTQPGGGGVGETAPGRNLLGDFLSNESGAVPLLSYPEIDAQSIRAAPSPLGQGLVDDVVRIFNPAARARVAAGIIREGMARSELGLLRVSNALRRFGRAVGEMPSVDRRQWMDAYETGNLGKFEGTWAGDMAKGIHDQFEASYARMEELGIAPEYVENYLPHIWADPEAASGFIASKRLEGNKAFTRERSYQLISEGMANGLKLVTDDPVELSLLQMQQQQKFIAAHEIRQALEGRGLATKVDTENAEGARGLVKLNIAGGQYFAPETVATLFNRLLSPGLSGRPAYDALRAMTSLTAQAKLIGSVYHPMVLAKDAVAGQMGLGIKGIGRGVMRGDIAEIGKGLVKIGTSPAAPFINAYKGSKYISELINGPGADPFRATVADAIISSGARVQPAGEYHPTASGSFLRVLKNGTFNVNAGGRTLGQETVQMFRDAQPIKIGSTTVAPAYVRAMGQWVGRALDTISSPIMEVAVPHMKMGAIAQEMEDLLRAHPNLGQDDIRLHGGRIVDQVDNRLGEMTYDNMFWNKTLQDINHVVFFAPGWMMGKLRLMGSVGLDALKGGLVSVGEEKELSSNITYLAGLIGATAMTSAAYGYLQGSWKPDWSWRDYFAPPNKNGTRMSMPGFEKDIYGWLSAPGTEGSSKINPMWGTISDLLQNREYDGGVITDPRKPWLDNAEDYLDFTAQQFAPMIAQPAQSEAQQELSPFERFLGVRPAPYAIREPERTEKFEQRDEKKALRKANRRPQ